MSARLVYERILHNDATMDGPLPSTQILKYYDHCRGIHGAARERKGTKRGTSAARRRHDKIVIAQALEEY